MPRRQEAVALPEDPLWYKDAVIYQTHVRTFFDSNADGIGDFRGLTQKLDYLEDLGVTAVWILPFYPSPLKDDGYDIADYTNVHPSYGTMRDFNTFVREAHRRGLRVITELVINHTSDQHAWFQRARRAAPGSKEREFYVWSDTTDKYKGTRIIFKDFEPSNWAPDPVSGEYYWHRFYSHQPDLNYDNPEVHKAVFRALDFWMQRGVDGLRLDAIPYLYEREGTSCENLPETHTFLKQLRQHVDTHFPNRMVLAEANQWPEDAVAYFGDGDECHTAFHFPVMPRLFMALRMEDRYPIIDIMRQTPAIPDLCQWVMFLRNHDELTLEMVTDRERDYMYQVYARDREMRINLGIRRRLAPLLGNERRAIELMNCLLFSLPGTPVIYYGDEIGMGDNVYLGDRNGVRTPMQWSADRNAGFSRANPQRLYLPPVIDPEYHYESINVEAQQNNPRSLLWWMKRLIQLRKRYTAFGRGSLEFLHPSNSKVLAFVREYGQERILVVANLSRFAQHVDLDLARFEGAVPIELFGQTRFPTVADGAYRMMLGPYNFHWFALEAPQVEVSTAAGPEAQLPTLKVTGNWENVFQERQRGALQQALVRFLPGRRWFGGKARTIDEVRVRDTVRITHQRTRVAYVAIVEVEYTDHAVETYVLPLTFVSGDQAVLLRQQSPEAVFAALQVSGKDDGVLYDAMWDADFCQGLLQAFNRRRSFAGTAGELVASATRELRPVLRAAETPLQPKVSRAEQSNTSVFYGDQLILKLFRRLEAGVNPDLEISRFLTEKGNFPHTPPMAGGLEYRTGRGEPMSLGILQRFVSNQGDAWQYTLDALGRFFERALARAGEVDTPPLPRQALLRATDEDVSPLAREVVGFYLNQAGLLGQRTAELHLALASEAQDPNFAPEAFTDFFQRSQFQAMRGQVSQVWQLLRNRLNHIPEDAQEEVQRVLDRDGDVMQRLNPVRDHKFSAMRIRTHGDYHLGQVLYTGRDFVIIDFEGEPARSLSERRAKTSALRDVSGMLRSFHYASFAAALQLAEQVLPASLDELEPWRHFWYAWVTTAFLHSYLDTAAEAVFLPKAADELQLLLDAYTLDKAVYELGYELNNRPRWVGIPVRGILQILDRPAS